MTDKEEKALGLTLKHKELIAKYMAKFSAEVTFRAAIHDDSKFRRDEFEAYAECADEFDQHPFNSQEERALREKLYPAMSLHKQRNRHHPEHFENGMTGMNLIDLLEMLCDWKSASERTPGDSIRTALPILKEKYNISPQLMNVLTNTIRDFNMY